LLFTVDIIVMLTVVAVTMCIILYGGAEQSGTSYTVKTLHKISWER